MMRVFSYTATTPSRYVSMIVMMIVLVLQCVVINSTYAFQNTAVVRPLQQQQQQQQQQRIYKLSHLYLSENNNSSDNNDSNDNTDRIRQLGFTDTEIRQSVKKSIPQREEMKVRVDIVDDVDPVTLTAIGFALIALNFLVFANLGDGGISGLVARFINSM